MFRKEFLLSQNLFGDWDQLASLWGEGLQELCTLSFSVRNCFDVYGGASNLSEAISILGKHSQFSPAPNGTGWELPTLTSSPINGVSYTTTGGLSFGWRPVFSGPTSTESCRQAGWAFWIQHPKGVAPAESTLRTSAEAAGWAEVAIEHCLPIKYLQDLLPGLTDQEAAEEILKLRRQFDDADLSDPELILAWVALSQRNGVEWLDVPIYSDNS